MTKIDIFSGFLGAGKTTLIRKLIKEAYTGEKLVLIENEFGEIGVDGGFLQDAGVEITEMNAGCICCSLVGDFSKALREVLDRFHPDRILIEPSGVGKLSDIVRAANGVSGDVRVNGLTTVVDAGKCTLYMRNFGEFFDDQVENAATILLSRTQGMDEEKLAACVALLRARNPEAVIVTTPWDALGGAQILQAIEGQDTLTGAMAALHAVHEEDGDVCPVCGHHHEHAHDDDDDDEHEHHGHGAHCGCHAHEHGHHHADDIFTSWGVETAKKFTADALHAALAALDDAGLYGTVLRAKGIVDGAEGWLYFDYVPGEASVRNGAPAVTGRICVIGANLKTEALSTLFGLGACR